MDPANMTAETTTIDAPIGKSVDKDNKNPRRQLNIPIKGETINIFLKS